MNIDLEHQVMDTFMLSRLILRRLELRFNEISELSQVKKSTLQRILPRLVARKWIQKIEQFESRGSIGQMIWVRGKNKEKVLEWVLLPKESVDYFESEYPNLVRSRPSLDDDVRVGDESLTDVIKIMHPRKQSRILREKSLRFKGRNKLLKDSYEKFFSHKQYISYKLIEYPYFYRMRGGFMKSDENDLVAKPWNVPVGTKRFWKAAAEDIKKIRRKWKLV